VNLGKLWEEQKSWKQAASAYERAEGLLGPLTDQFPEVVDFRHLLVLTYTNSAVALLEQKDFDAADKKRDLAQEGLKVLIKQAPGVLRFQQLLAQNYSAQGIYLAQLNLKDQSRAAFTEAHKVLDKLRKTDPQNADIQLDLGVCQLDQGIAAAKGSDVDGAEKQYRQAVATVEKVGRDFTPPPAGWLAAAIKCHFNLALLLVYRKEVRESEKHWQRLSELAEKSAQSRPNNAQRWADLALYQSSLARYLHQRGADAEARDWYGKALIVLLTKCIPLTQKDVELSPAEKAKLLRTYGGEAMTALQRAVDLGYKDVDQLKKAEFFAPLRERMDFKELIKRLEVKR
jgi:tetratricopeptide (TPR) repeat protein